MTWTTPKTWVANEPLTANDLNLQVRDNLTILRTLPSAAVVLNEVADYATASTAFVDINSTKLSLTITTTGGNVLVGFLGTVYSSGAFLTYFDFTRNGVRQGGDDGIVAAGGMTNGYLPVDFVYLVTGLAAGSHTFKMQWRVQAGASTLWAGAGTVATDLHPQFWVKEV